MIPYFTWQSVQLGPLMLNVWGFFVAVGFLAAALAAGWMVKRCDGEDKVIYDLTVWMMITGLIGGRLGHILFYEPAAYFANPLEVFAIWHGGMSLFGGIILSTFVGVWYLRKRHVDIWKYSDAVFFGLPIGLFVGRIGCFLIHDHPGTATNFFLGIEYPDGIVRHDHGLYLSLSGLAMAIAFFFLAKKNRPTGFFLGLFTVWYGIVRFVLDFYRTLDVRYGGLTPGQYFSLILFIFGSVVLCRIYTKLPSKTAV
jgi:phosphatidylglycerol---prolipoprotein diacylglyceryl transferase